MSAVIWIVDVPHSGKPLVGIFLQLEVENDTANLASRAFDLS
jgi:hypothetical protein